MDSIRVSKVENVSCTQGRTTTKGIAHLTAHHLIFQYIENSTPELWIPYPLIALVTRLPQTLHGENPITIQTRTFETLSLSFGKETEAIDVFESVKELTVAPSVEQLYAFHYTPNPPLPTRDGWNIYSPRDEFRRMGVGSRTKAWRFTDINKDYSFSPTYPAKFVVPTRISDTTLQYAGKYRSKCRIPVLTYLHWSNYGSITRSSQPMVGITQNRSIQDEKLIEAIFQSHHNPESRVSAGPVYGAMSTNLIIDARPTTNAMANTAKGAGTENMDHYKDSKKVYLGIDHIHTMRDSLSKVVEALKDADTMLNSLHQDLDLAGEVGSAISVLDRQALRRSGWLRHIVAILEGTVIIARNVHVNSSHVLIHCSDGWDRTSQLSALSQLCLDPFYRTIRGFEILVEKDWLSYGHKFMDRCGHLSSDKFFVSQDEVPSGGGRAEVAQAFLASVQNRFVGQGHLKETSPVFHQFLESVRQIQRQFPKRFEFNERFLHQIYYHLYSCQFGTFLFNNEKERRTGDGSNPAPCERTISIWDFFNSPEELAANTSEEYDQSLDDPSNRAGDMGVLLPNPKDVRFWHELYGRTDEEMNGRAATPGPVLQKEVELVGPVENNDEDPVLQIMTSPSSVPLPPSPSRSGMSSRIELPLSPPSPSPSPAPSALHSSPLVDSPDNAAPERPYRNFREDSFQPFASSSSVISMKGPNSESTSSLPPSTRTTPAPAGRAADLFSNVNVKSMWGRLQSNASAALSVVQDAYVKTGSSSQADENNPSSAQVLRDRQSLNVWGEDSTSSTESSTGETVLSTSNPWSTPSSSVSDGQPNIFSDNPWGTVRSPSRGKDEQNIRRSPASAPQSSLPHDPMVSDTLSARFDTSASLRSPTRSPIRSPARVVSPAPPQTPSTVTSAPSANTDPLGVGLIN